MKLPKGFPNVSYYKHDFIGFADEKWQPTGAKRLIFGIDSDEVADEALIESIRAAVLENEKEHFSLYRSNHYHGRLIKGCWYPDIIPRLTIAIYPFSDRQVRAESLCCRRKPG